MSSREPKFRKQLNSNQIAILELLFRYRFGSVELISRALGKKHEPVVYKSLANLIDQGYAAKHFEQSYRLKGQPAAYYLLPTALKLLKTQDYKEEITDAVIKNSYRDKTVSQSFITHYLAIFAIANHLLSLYRSMELFTKPELTTYTYLPNPLSDTFMSLEFDGTTYYCLLEYFEDRLPPFAIETRIKQLVTYYQNDAWAATKSPFPPLLCICESGTLEKQFSRRVSRSLFRNDCDASFYTTTLKALLSIRTPNETIWSNAQDSEELLSLEQILVNT
jgi:hypothetical protein